MEISHRHVFLFHLAFNSQGRTERVGIRCTFHVGQALVDASFGVVQNALLIISTVMHVTNVLKKKIY